MLSSIMKLKTRKETVIEEQDFDDLVQKTYGRIYSFQQQDGCKSRGVHHFTVPAKVGDDDWPDSIPEIVNGPEEGVSFKAWLARDPKQSFPNKYQPEKLEDQWGVDLWWARNFHPPFWAVVNDLHSKGLIDAGEYLMNIDW